MVANIFEDFEPPCKKFLATPLVSIYKSNFITAAFNRSMKNTFFNHSEHVK